jgi:hypothetical protein
VELQQLVATIRPHPFGEAGVRSSLDEVARYVSKGISNPYVRTYAIDKLAEAKQRGVNVDSPRGRAETLLRVFQNEKLWVPDPVNAEYMPEAHLIACDPKKPHVTPEGKTLYCKQGDDCDGKVIGLASCFGAVGLHTVIVGHGYEENHIEHVLCMAWLGKRWYYADPSLPELALGQCVPFVRERVLSVPNIQVLCDARSCMTGQESRFDPDEHNFVDKGVFVGVAGVPTSYAGMRARVVWVPDERPPVKWLGSIGEATPPDNHQQQKQQFSTLEKILLAGTFISATTLAITLYDRAREL